MMEEKIRIPENGSSIPVLHHFAKSIQYIHAEFVRFVYLRLLTGKDSNQGSFSDTVTDQVVVTFSTITLIHSGNAGIWPGSLYLFFYAIVVFFGMVRNAMAIPYSCLVRPRFIIYAWIAIDLYLWPGTLNLLLWIMTFLLGAKMLSGFIQIRRRM